MPTGWSESLAKESATIAAQYTSSRTLVAAAKPQHLLNVHLGNRVEVESLRPLGPTAPDQRVDQLAVDLGICEGNRALDQVL